jgi:hypothetical protein
MTDETNDTSGQNEKMDALIKGAAADYNRPNATPREAIWERIQAQRASGEGAARVTRPSNNFRRYAGIGLAVAATLVIGVVIGGRIERARTSTVALGGAASGPVPATAPDSVAANAYRHVMLEHIGNSEAMIMTFRATARAGTVDKQMADWSGDLLLRTRMLESSPAAQDPVMKRLLEDLDLVLAQITQYSGRATHRADDLDLIEQSIEQRGVMTKLRATIPAPTTASAIKGS